MNHQLWSALNELDPALIDSARPNQLNKKTNPALTRPARFPNARSRHIFVSASLGVILILALIGGLAPNIIGIVTPSPEPSLQPSSKPDLPLVMLDIKALGGDSNDSNLKYDHLDKLHEMRPNFLEGVSTFPIYSGMNVPEHLAKNAQKRIWGMAIVEELNLELIEVIEEKEASDQIAGYITLRCREADLIVGCGGSYSFEFHDPIDLPNVNDRDASGLTPQQAQEVLDEIRGQYNQLFSQMGLTRPVAVAQSTIPGYHFYFYQDADDAGNRENNKKYNRIRVNLDGNGRLESISRLNYAPRSDQFIGNYPIVNSERARELLYEGRYYTYWRAEDFKVDEQSEIVGWEVLLLPDAWGTDVQLAPFYRFYVRIDRWDSYYNVAYSLAVPFDVPAIDLSYIGTIPDRTIYEYYDQ